MAIPRRMRTLLVVISCSFSPQQLFSASAPTQRTPAFFSRSTERPVFIENRGQFDKRVLYQIRVHNQAIWLTNNGLTFDIARSRSSAAHTPDKTHLPEIERLTFRAEFLHSLKPTSIEHLAELPGTYNFFSADPERSHSDVHGYSGVVYRGLWKGIDLKLYSKDGSNLEQEFIVHRGGDISQIRLQYERVQGIDLKKDGSLHIDTGHGVLSESAPLIYATRKGIRTPVHGRFVLCGAGQYGFQIDSPIDADELLIDPTLGFSTYLGSSSGATVSTSSGAITYATGMEVDSAGYVYVTGTTTATDFPETSKFVAESTRPYPLSVYVVKLSPDGSRPIYSTLLEGAWNGFQGTYQSTPAPNSSHVLALNTAGEVYVSGLSLSGFPSTPNAFQQCSGENWFISKISSGGDNLLYSSCLSNNLDAQFLRMPSIAVNATDQVYMVGTVECGTLPVTTGAYQETCTNNTNSNYHAYLAVFDAAKSGIASLVYSTYFGPPGTQGVGLAIGSSGAAYLTGITSLQLPFPVTPGALQATYSASYSGFVSKLEPTISGKAALVSSTLFGGNSQPNPSGIALDSIGNIYIAGILGPYDPNLNEFPTTTGAFQPLPNNAESIGFMAKISPNADQLLYSTFLGGNFNQGIYALAVDPSGNAAVTGQTLSSHFPLSQDAFQSSLSPSGADAFLSVISSDGSQLV